ncbi:MAG: polysaccharide biosynthesis protein [Thermoplasmatales archaeon]
MRKRRSEDLLMFQRLVSEQEKDFVGDIKVKQVNVLRERNLVSIVIPSYYTKKKSPQFLFSCIRSIFSSTYPKYEVIIVDDNSEIDLSMLLSTLQVKEKVRIIRNRHNLGYGASCNRGAAIAKGEFILFLNDDMEVSPDLLEVLVESIKKYPKIGILFSKEIDYYNPNSISTGCLMDSFGNTLARKNPKNGLIFYAPGAPCFIKANVFHEVMGFDESFYLFMEAVKTNILGTWNIKKAAIENNVEYVLGISTDKAVKPINVYGMTKALDERILLNNEIKSDTKFSVVRYGNVVGSRGSVIPYWYKLAKEGKDLPLTDERMTRFWITLKEAIELIFFSLKNHGKITVRACKAFSLRDLAQIYKDKFNVNIKIVGIRPGEKLHECLLSDYEMRKAFLNDPFYIVDIYRKDIKKDASDFDSNSAEKIKYDEMKSLLTNEGFL